MALLINFFMYYVAPYKSCHGNDRSGCHVIFLALQVDM